jgi:hypothetical protein
MSDEGEPITCPQCGGEIFAEETVERSYFLTENGWLATGDGGDVVNWIVYCENGHELDDGDYPTR